MLTGKRFPREEIEGFIEYLASKYPATFFLDPRQKRPLKKNIVADLERDGTLDDDARNAAVNFYTRDWSYERCLQAGVERVDLDGKKVGTVTEQEQIEARKRVEQQKAERRERERKLLRQEKKEEATVLPAFVTTPPKANGHTEPETKVCAACGEPFKPYHHMQKLCTPDDYTPSQKRLDAHRHYEEAKEEKKREYVRQRYHQAKQQGKQPVKKKPAAMIDIPTTNNAAPELNRLHHLLSRAEKFLSDTDDGELRTRLAVTALDLIINEATNVRAQLEGSNAS